MNPESVVPQSQNVTPVQPAPVKKSGKAAEHKIIQAVGRRKNAIARVRMVANPDGSTIEVNGRTMDEYFGGNNRQKHEALGSLRAVKSFAGYDIFISVLGGGITGQSGAIRHGIARAMSKTDEKIRLQMRKEGYLTRDPRVVERKKPGQPKARKRFQYSKR